MVATNIAEVKGAEMNSGGEKQSLMEGTEATIGRIRSKLSSLDSKDE